jgi:hypothetical protein
LLIVGNDHPRIEREKTTVKVMIHICYGAHHRAAEGLYQECRDLLQHALECLEKCSFQEDKPTRAYCPIHGYRPSTRGEIRVVMSYSGPRMLYRHPILAVRHVIDGLRRHTIESEDEGKLRPDA